MSPLIRKPKPQEPRPVSPPKIIKANPIRLPPAPFEPIIAHRVIEPPVDFTLPGDEIRQKKLRDFEEEVRRKEEEDMKNRNFIARPLPDLFPDV